MILIECRRRRCGRVRRCEPGGRKRILDRIRTVDDFDTVIWMIDGERDFLVVVVVGVVDRCCRGKGGSRGVVQLHDLTFGYVH